MKNSIYTIAKTDADSEENGKWFDDIFEEGSGISLKLRRMTSQAYIKVLNRLMQENRKLMVKGKFPKDVDMRLLVESMAEGIIVDWKGIVVEEGGEEIPYSKDAAIKLMTELPDLKSTVRNLAQSMAAFRAETKEEIAGN